MEQTNIYLRYLVLILLIQLYLFVYNLSINGYEFITPKSVAIYLVYSLCILLIYSTLYKYFRSKIKVSFIFSSILIIVNFFNLFKEAIKSLSIFTDNYLIKYSIEGVCSVIFLYFLFRLRNNKIIDKIYTVSNISFSVLSIICIISILSSNFNKGEKVALNKFENHTITNKYNFILIILDSYTSDSVLNYRFRFKNPLKLSDDYHIVKNTKSYYTYTAYSLSHIMKLGNNSTPTDLNKIRARIDDMYNSNITSYFYSNGYTCFNYSFFDMKNTKGVEQLKNIIGLEQTVDNNMTLLSTTIFQQLRTTLHYFKLRNVFNLDFLKTYGESAIQTHKKNIIYTNNLVLDKLQSTNIDTPFFLYAHFMLPHDPYCFDSLGKLKDEKDTYFTTNKEGYLDNLLYSNKLIEKIDSVFQQSSLKNKTIILIQGDHGSRVTDITLDDNEKRGILNIVYLPDGKYHTLENTTTNLNTVLSIFNSYFQQNFKMVEYRSL